MYTNVLCCSPHPCACRPQSGSLCVPVASAVQHGVLAQEVARILPQAVVRTVGRVDEYALTGTLAGEGVDGDEERMRMRMGMGMRRG